MQPYSQPFFWVTTVSPTNPVTYWINGVPFSGVQNGSAPTGGLQFWFNGAPVSQPK